MSGKPTYEELEKRVLELQDEAIKRRRAEEAVKEREESLKVLMNATTETAVLVNMEGKILAINRTTAKGFGKSVDELIGTALFDNFPADLAVSRKTKHREVILSGKPVRFMDERAGRIYDNTVYPVFDSKGDITALAIYAGDITERNRAYEELRESEERFSSMVENIPGTVYRCLNDLHWTMLYVSEAIKNLTGYPASDFLQNKVRTYTSIIHPDDRQVVYEKVRKALSKGISFTLEYRVIDADGEEHWTYERGQGIRGKDNEVVYIDGVILDITDRKQAENAARESEEFAKAALNATTEMVFLVDPNGDLLALNNNAAQSFGKTPNELIGRNIFDLFPPDLAKTRKGQGERVARSGKPFRYQDEREGRYFDISIYPTFDTEGRVNRLAVFVADITDRKNAEESLREEKDRAQMYLDVAGVMLVALDATGNIVMMNKKGCEILDCGEDQILGKNWFDHFVPEDVRENVRSVFQKLMKGDLEPVEYHENEVLTKSGERRLLAWHNALLIDEKDDTIGTLSSGEDITERKQAEEAMRRSSIIIDSTTDAVITTDVNGIIVYWNKGAEIIYGYQKNEVLGKSISILYKDEDLPILEAMMADLLEGNDISGKEVTCINKYEQDVEMLLSLTTIKDNDGNIIELVGTTKDITDRKRAEEERRILEKQLQQVQKMEAIGTLAGGIAHDFNNILASIFGYTELSKIKLGTGENIERYLDEVLNAGFRARDLVKQILAFSRQTDIDRIPITIQPLVKESLKFLRASLPSSIEIRSDLGVSDSTIMVDPTQVHQIILNLCTNATYAMKEKGGVLELRLDEVEIGNERTTPYKDLKRGKYIRLIVSDTGHGIPEELMDKIFDPFFTTKERGEGTGMGLSVVHGIIEDMKGSISVSSELGKGTTFELLIPLYEGEIVDSSPVHDSLKERRGRILFVDDEEGILDSGREILKRLGYEVVTTTSPVQALEIFKAEPDDFDLVLTDMTMPQINGIELSKNLTKIRLDIPIILCTGYAVAVTQEELRDAGISDTVMKPMITNELVTAIDHVINPENE